MSIFSVLAIAAVALILCTTIGCLIASSIQKKKKAGVPIIEIEAEPEDSKEVSASEEKKALPEKEGIYSGVLHISKGRYRFERPVMYNMYRGKKVFFEYDDEGNKIALCNGDMKANINRLIEDHTLKFHNLKWYPLDKE